MSSTASHGEGVGQSCRPESPIVAVLGKLETPIGPHEVDEGWAVAESLRRGWPPARKTWPFSSKACFQIPGWKHWVLATSLQPDSRQQALDCVPCPSQGLHTPSDSHIHSISEQTQLLLLPNFCSECSLVIMKLCRGRKCPRFWRWYNERLKKGRLFQCL